MGTVAFIEEKGDLNMGLGMPAGLLTVTAAGSIFSYNFTLYFRDTKCNNFTRILQPEIFTRAEDSADTCNQTAIRRGLAFVSSVRPSYRRFR